MTNSRPEPRLYTGTSGFAYKEWKGSFYPEDMKDAGMLPYYASHFGSCEINNTFYRMPSDKVLMDWAAQVPADFRFVLKASRQITHTKRLKEGVEDAVDYFLKNARILGEQLGPILIQLPPNMKVDLDRLKRFIEHWPDDVRAAWEFRHESWHDDTVFETLRAHGHALCIAHTEDETTPFVPTASWGYLRLRGVVYQEGELEQWIRQVKGTDWSEAFVFFKHEDEGTGPALAKRFSAAYAGDE